MLGKKNLGEQIRNRVKKEEPLLAKETVQAQV
jgi:hypothetical protein